MQKFDQPSAKRQTRGERLLSRPHPFRRYRLNADKEQAQQDQEERVVTTYLTGKVAIALKADGTTTSADGYRKGSNGFIIAEWLAEKLELQLEVPK